MTMPKLRYEDAHDAEHEAHERGRLHRPSRADRATTPADAPPSGPKITGRIKAMNKERGFGFITTQEDGGARDYFFHRYETAGKFDELMVGDSVTFRRMASPKGPRAHEVEFVLGD